MAETLAEARALEKRHRLERRQEKREREREQKHLATQEVKDLLRSIQDKLDTKEALAKMTVLGTSLPQIVFKKEHYLGSGNVLILHQRAVEPGKLTKQSLILPPEHQLAGAKLVFGWEDKVICLDLTIRTYRVTIYLDQDYNQCRCTIQ